MEELGCGKTLQGGKYKIVKTLGRGNFGITYLATTKVALSGGLGKMDVTVNVAIKEFFMEEFNSSSKDGSSVDGSNVSLFKNYRKKFYREAENLSKLRHPNIVKVLEVFDENNTTYYAMEFVNGESLDDYIKSKGRMPEEEVLGQLKEIGEALQYMHENKMLHLDLKPKNIMRNMDGHMLLIDFGLSKQYNQNGEPESSTTLGHGTPGYAPIEQENYKQDGTFPATLDIYALGATVYKMLTGSTPPHASDILSEGFPEDLFAKLRISIETTAMVRKAMSPVKKQRYQNVSELLDNIKSAEPDDIRNKDYGSYKKVVSEAEFGTENVINVEIDDPLLMPDSVIRLSLKNPLPGTLSYDFYLDISGPNNRHNAIIYRGKKKIADEFWWGALSKDVIDALRKNGFFSKVHWEKESSTTPLTGIDVSCAFFYKNGEKFVREVKYANPSYRHLLLDAVQNVVKVKELSKWIDCALDREQSYSREDIDQYGISILSITPDHKLPIYYRGHSFIGNDIGVSKLKSQSGVGNAFERVKYSLQKNNDGRKKLDIYLTNNQESIQNAFNIVTYCSKSDLYRILNKLKQNPAVFGRHRIIQEMQLVALCFGDIEDTLVSFEYQHLYCETVIDGGVYETLKSGYLNEKQAYTKEAIDQMLSEQEVTKHVTKNLSTFEGFAYFILGGIAQYHILEKDWEEDAVLLSTFPFDIKCEIWINGRYRDGLCLIDRDTTIPCQRSEIINDDNCTLIISFLGKRFSLNIKELFWYNPKFFETLLILMQGRE